MRFFDAAYRRYAAPLELFDRMLAAGRLAEFVCSMVEMENEEAQEKALWECWLHKDFRSSWAEFREGLTAAGDAGAALTAEETARIVGDSVALLEAFRPEGGDAQDDEETRWQDGGDF